MIAIPINCFTLRETGFGEEGEANQQAKNTTTVFVQHFVFFQNIFAFVILFDPHDHLVGQMRQNLYPTAEERSQSTAGAEWP